MAESWGWFVSRTSDIVQAALSIVQIWFVQRGISVNDNKTRLLLLFTTEEGWPIIHLIQY